MLKRTLNIAELIMIGFVIIGITGFYQASNSIPRFFLKIEAFRYALDFLIISSLLFRVIFIFKTFRKNYQALAKPKTLEKVAYLICLISLIPDLSTWIQWKYFVGFYLYIFIMFSIPTILWTVEFIERSKRSKLRNYGLAILTFVIPIIGYLFFLSRVT